MKNTDWFIAKRAISSIPVASLKEIYLQKQSRLLVRYEQARQFAYQTIEDTEGKILFPFYIKILFAQLDIVA